MMLCPEARRGFQPPFVRLGTVWLSAQMVIQKPKGDWNLYKEEVKPVHAACEAGDIVAVSEFFEAGSEAREWLAEEVCISGHTPEGAPMLTRVGERNVTSLRFCRKR